MKSYYTYTIYVVYLLFCLLITSASAQSLIRQSTDDRNTPLQPEENGAKAVSILGEAHYLDKDDLEISSSDYKVSPSNQVTGMRSRPPMSYSLKMESFNTLLQSNNTERYESRPFPVGGYNWSLIVYPNGNREDSGSGFISLYVAIDNSTLVSSHQEVFADLRFYVFKRTERKFFTVQDTNVWRYNIFKTMWGFPRVLPLDTFRNPSNGYLFNGDHCEFGVDVTIHTPFQRSELFTVARNFPNPRFTWNIQRFSTLLGETYFSDVFSIGGRNWNIQVHPSGAVTGEGRALSMYLLLNANERFRPYEKIYVRAQLRVLNQRASSQWRTIERPIDHWFTGPGLGWGYDEFVPLADLRDPERGYLVNDKLMVQVEMEAISSTRYFPS
ncbi:probable inactive serine/threonine-protein kinase fnkC isoform X1 [Brassica rapa]|nr:probable inactive serine/threonine-protein kinase fnkC isoform X1 [Brassica rapa]XP_022572258.2 probable inactive serine/threonine-protein kinase fnkC isoform X1 [Brassica napus]